MTSASCVPGAEEHPEVPEISDLGEGLLPPQRSAEVRAHLAQCLLCSEVQESLREIRDALGTLPGPARMPTDVVERMDAALAAEALLDATAPTASAQPAAVTTAESASPVDRAPEEHRGSPAGPSDRDGIPNPADGLAAGECRRQHPLGVSVSRETAVSRETRHPRQRLRPVRNGSAPGPKGPRTQPHRRRRTALLTTAGLVAALGVGGAVLQGLDNTSGGDATSSDTGVARQDAAGQGLGDRVRDLLSEHEAGKEQAEGLAPSPDISVRQSPRSDSPMAGGDTTLPSCVREGIGRSETPLAADSSHPYRGKPSYLVVLPHSGDPQKVDAYVVDSRCATGSVLGPGKVLLERTYPRK